MQDLPEPILKIISDSYDSYDEQISRLIHIGEISEKELNMKNALIQQIKEKEFDSVLTHLPGLVMWLSRDLKYLGVNDNISKAFGKTREEIIGKSIDTDLGLDNSSLVEKVQEFKNSSKEEDNFEFILNLLDSQRHIITFIQKFDEGSKILLMGIDTTETIKMQQELEEGRAIETHNARLISLGEMSASIAHEINNPLATLEGNLLLLRKNVQEPSGLSRLDKCDDALQRITTILTNIKLMSRNTQNDQTQIVSLRNIIDTSLELIYQKTKDRNISIKIDVENDFQIKCHISEMIQVFHNLFNNSIDAIAHQSEQWLKISARAEENNIIIKIIDSGEGIPDKVLSQLFKPFFTTKPIGKGTGLGMGISLKIVNKHGGILYYDKTNTNTCFIITLPQASPLAS